MTDIYVGGGAGILLPLPANLRSPENERSVAYEIQRRNRRWGKLERKAKKLQLRFNQELQQVRRLEEKHR